MGSSGTTPFKLVISSLVVFGILASLQATEAKSIRSFGYFDLRGNDAIKMRRGGCAAFGHSCFGGHGKRADTTINPSEVEEFAVGIQPPRDEGKTFADGDGPQTPAEIFKGDDLDNNEVNFALPSRYQNPVNYIKLSPFIRKWLENSYRRGDLIRVNK